MQDALCIFVEATRLKRARGISSYDVDWSQGMNFLNGILSVRCLDIFRLRQPRMATNICVDHGRLNDIILLHTLSSTELCDNMVYST